jgi:ribosomal-protein-alanine N-acetyltransferase
MHSGWKLRAGREEDIRAMYMLDLVCFDEPFRFNLASMRRFVQHRGATVIVAESEGKLIGFVVVHPVKRALQNIAYVVTLDVAREFRRRGLARELMQAAERQAAKAGAGAMALHVYAGNDAAVDFYERAGYVRQERVQDFYGEGLDGWVYSKQLISR